MKFTFPMNVLNLTPTTNPGKSSETVKITFVDIQSEVGYWTNAILCHVLGANHPLQVMEGFIRRVWGKLGIDKVAIAAKGIFLVRFMSFESRSKVLEEGIPMFEKINGHCSTLGC